MGGAGADERVAWAQDAIPEMAARLPHVRLMITTLGSRGSVMLERADAAGDSGAAGAEEAALSEVRTPCRRARPLRPRALPLSPLRRSDRLRLRCRSARLQVLRVLKERAAALPYLVPLAVGGVVPRAGAAADTPLRLRRLKALRHRRSPAPLVAMSH